MTAPHDTMNRVPSTRTIRPSRSISAATTLAPFAVVISRSARALVHSVTLGRSSAGRTPQTSASLLA